MIGPLVFIIVSCYEYNEGNDDTSSWPRVRWPRVLDLSDPSLGFSTSERPISSMKRSSTLIEGK